MFGESANDRVRELELMAAKLGLPPEDVPKEVIFDVMLTAEDVEMLQRARIEVY
jgi:hypothetical protein